MELIIQSRQKKKTGLFFIALIPNRELRMKIYPFKFDFFKRFGSRKALEVYTHMTLKAPFICPYNGKKDLVDWFSEMPVHQTPFPIHLNGFKAFYNKKSPVVFINPVTSSELVKMQSELIVGFNSIFPAYVHPVDLDFKPHITVAYRDLTPENFSRAWQEYKDKPFNDIFDVNAIYLLEHDGKSWNIIHTRKLG